MIPLLLLLLLLPMATPAATYEVGPGRQFATIGAAPWTTLQPGDQVLIHWRTEAYREKWVIGRTGTAAAPLVIRGVPNATGALPVIDGSNAVTPRGLDFWNEDRGVVKIGGSSVPPDNPFPSYVVIENLEIIGAKTGGRFTGANGGSGSYLENAAGIFLERGNNITIRGCSVHDNGNGIFVASSATEPSRDILIERNRIFLNGYAGSTQQHNTYTEAAGITYQYNHMGPLQPNSEGNNLKDRSAGTVVRYNWIEGGNRQIDLVEAGSAALLADSRYSSAHVYGNVLIDHPGLDNDQVINFGGDGGNLARYRGGTAYVFNNTVVSWRTDTVEFLRLVLPSARGDLRNNIFYAPDARTRVSVLNLSGTVEARSNWFPSNVKVAAMDAAPVVVNDVSGNIKGTAPGFVDAKGGDFRLLGGSAAINSGSELAALIELTQQYVKHASFQARPRVGALDLGAFEFEGRVAWGIPSLTAPGVFPAVAIRR